MGSFDKILHLCDFFEKNAQALPSLDFENSPKTIDMVYRLLLWLTGKEIPLKEIDYWMTQNESILEQYNIHWYLIQPNNYEHILQLTQYRSGKQQYSIIAPSNDFADNIEYDITKHGFLKGYKTIPNLYIFTAIDSAFDGEPLSKTLAPFSFIEKTLKNQGSVNQNDVKELFSEFIETNKPNLLKLMSSFSYAPKYIGGGMDGSAFDIGENKVLKIFSESYSYYKAKESYDRLHKNPELAKNEAMIYDVGIIGKFKDLVLYYYIMEKMKPLNDNLRNYMTSIVGYIGQYIRHDKERINKYRKLTHDPKNNNTIKEFLDQISNKLEQLLYSEHSREIYNIETYVSNDSDMLNQNWVKSLCEEILFKYMTGRGDLHLGNLGITNYGNFVYFDPSHSYWENNNDVVNTPSRDSIDFAEQQHESDMFV